MKRERLEARLVPCMCAAPMALRPLDWVKDELPHSRRMENGCWRVRPALNTNYSSSPPALENREQFPPGMCWPNPLIFCRIRGAFWKSAVSPSTGCGYGYKTAMEVSHSPSALEARWSAAANVFRRTESKLQPAIPRERSACIPWPAANQSQFLTPKLERSQCSGPRTAKASWLENEKYPRGCTSSISHLAIES